MGLSGFATLGDETRLKIFLKIIELSSFSFINEEPVLSLNTAKHITEVFGLAKSTVSHHIDVLKEADLIFEIKKKKYVYLFPNFTTISEFKDFINEEILVYHAAGQYVCIANLLLAKLPDMELETIKDLLVIEGCKNVIHSIDPIGNIKIYFKISGFNEPFYALMSNTSLKIFSMQKNYDDAKQAIIQLSNSLIRSLQ